MENLQSFLAMLTEPAIVALVMAIVGLIKDKGMFEKIDTRLISLVVSAIVVALIMFVAIPDATIGVLEIILLIILPALGYDYLYDPIIRPFLDLKRNRGDKLEREGEG
jgi:hypothetical protein